MRDLISAHRPHIVMLLGNNPYPQDERVRREAQTLADAGYRVSVIAPRTEQQPACESSHGINVLRYKFHESRGSNASYAWEYLGVTLSALLLIFRLLRRSGLDAVHAHNPPDTFALIGAIARILGKRYIFDHHDLAPELYATSFGKKARRSIYVILMLLEKASCRLADHVIVTNESYKEIAIKRAHLDPAKVTVVRNGPTRFTKHTVRRCAPSRNGRIVIGYLGVMGRQDGIEHALRALKHLISDLNKHDVRLILIGDGVARVHLEKYAARLGLERHVSFTGYLSESGWREALKNTDICIVPDPSNAYNDRSTLVKVMDYMSLGKPIVAFDLPESRITAQDAAVFVPGNDDWAFAAALAELIDRPEQRAAMGAAGRKRVEEELAWKFSARSLLQVYETLLGAPGCVPKLERVVKASE